MKKILGLSVATLLIIALVVGGTLAFFSDTETSSASVLSTGTIDLAVNSANPWTQSFTTELTDMTPGEESVDIDLILTNVGTGPMDVWMMITGVVPDGGDDSYFGVSSEPEYVAEGAAWVGVAWVTTLWEANDDLGSIVSIALASGPALTGVDIGYDDILYVNDAKDSWIYLGELGVGVTVAWPAGTLGFKLGDTAEPDWAQGDTMEFTVQFYAQPVGIPVPGTELVPYTR